MDHFDYVALKAKVKMANGYLDQVLKHRGKVDTYDVLKVVTSSMRPFVEIVDTEQAGRDGLGIVRIRKAV